jgi:ATP-dependent RNA helicase SUPV3L1/SUV3
MAGPHPLTPIVEVKADDSLRNSLRHAVKTRLESWLTSYIESRLEPLIALRRASAARSSSWDEGGLPGPARGLAFRLTENLGNLPFEDTPLTPETRLAAKTLKRFGVKAGSRAFYLPRLIKPASSSLTAMLWAINNRLPQIPAPPNAGLTSFVPAEGDGPRGFLEAACYRIMSGRAVRLDIVDRIDQALNTTARDRTESEVTLSKLVSLLGSNIETAIAVAGALGWKRVTHGKSDPPVTEWRLLKNRKRAIQKRPPPDSPFAGLAALASSE